MKQIISTTVCFFLSLLFNACKKPGCFGSAGNTTIVSRPLPSFNELVIADNINLVLIQGTEQKMEIEGPQNMLSNISSTVSQNILTINNKTGCRWARNAYEKINVRLFIKDLKKLDYQGTGTIRNTDTLQLDALHIESNTGAGDIILTVNNRYTGVYVFQGNSSVTLHGKSESCFTYTNNRGMADMSDFMVKKMVIEYGGLRDTYINATDELTAVIFHEGNIYYKGSPVITKLIYHSKGRLLQSR